MICAIVLAAGRSRRMGVQKLLLPVAGQSLLCRVVDAVLAGSVEDVLVVTGPRREELEAALADRPVRWVTNPAADSEMIDSVRCGLVALPAGCEAFLIAARYRAEILENCGDVASRGVLEDIDSPADYLRTIARTSARITPAPAADAEH